MSIPRCIYTGNAPKHIVGMWVRAHQKSVYAQSRMHHGRKHRPRRYVVQATGRKFAIGRTKWERAHDRWQRRFGQVNRILDRHPTWVAEQRTVTHLDP